MPVDVFVRFLPRPDTVDAVETILRGMVAPTRAEPGALRYELYASAPEGSKREFNLIERYRDAAAVDAHRATEHYKAYRAAILPLLESPIHVTVLAAIDTGAAS